MCYGAEAIPAAAAATGSSAAAAQAAWVPAAYAALASATASTVGAYAQNRSANAGAEAAAKVERAEKFRQDELQRQADAKVREGIQQFTPENQAQQVQQAAATREAALQPVAAQPQEYNAGTVAAPVEVKSDLARRLGDVLAKGSATAAARARLAAFGDASQQEGFQMNRIREDLGRVGTQSQNSTRIFPFEQRAAMQGAGGRAALAGDLANTVGQIGSYYATHRTPAGIGYGAASTPPSGFNTPY